ncbi:MAG: peptidoglycan-associated lipoprotein Pal [Acidobacteriota bacterium]
MKRTGTTLTVIAIAAMAMLTVSTACKKKQPTTAQDARPPVSTGPSAGETNVPPPSTKAPGKDVEAEVLSMDIAALNKKGYLSDAFFDYDQADLREDARSALAANAEWLKKYPTVQVLMEGHCDDRGTAAYNLSLGERRANAAKDYMASLGVDGSRLRTVSYGKERPFCNDSSESCWQQNRRAHFVISAK